MASGTTIYRFFVIRIVHFCLSCLMPVWFMRTSFLFLVILNTIQEFTSGRSVGGLGKFGRCVCTWEDVCCSFGIECVRTSYFWSIYEHLCVRGRPDPVWEIAHSNPCQTLKFDLHKNVIVSHDQLDIVEASELKPAGQLFVVQVAETLQN